MGKKYEKVEEVDFWRVPDFYGKKTSKGTPMEQVLTARPRRLDVFSANKYCYFWGGGEGCRFCSIGPEARFYRKNPKAALCNAEEVEEAVVEAFKQKVYNSRVRLGLSDGKAGNSVCLMPLMSLEKEM